MRHWRYRCNLLRLHSRRLAASITVAFVVSACATSGAPSTTVSLSTAQPLDDQWVVAIPPTTASAAKPVVWFRDAVDDQLLVAYDWSGHFSGEMRVTATGPFGGSQSPDGAAVVLLHAKPASGGALVGRTRGPVTWARDSTHLCVFLTEAGDVNLPTMVAATASAQSGASAGTFAKAALYLDDPASGKRRFIEGYGNFGDHGGPTVLACSVPDDRAIVGSTTVGNVFDIRGLHLSDGHSLGAPGFASPRSTGNPADVVASPEDRLVAIGSSSSTWSLAGNAFLIREVESGATLATVAGGIAAFSDDDSRVLTVTYVGNSNDRGVYRLVDWRTGRVVWSAELPASSWTRRPGTGDILVEPWDYRAVPGANGTRQPFTRPFVVHADGSTTTLPTEVRPLDY